MSKKLFFLISFVLVLSLVSSVWAYDTVIWDNENGAGDRLWQTAMNWTIDAKPSPKHEVPTIDDWVIIDNLYTDDANGPIINADTTAVCEWISMGYYFSPPEEAVLTMTGGDLTVNSYFAIGEGMSGDYRFDISGGDVNVVGGDLYVADEGYGASGVVNMTGGTITIGEDLQIGNYDDAYGIFNMSAGRIELTTENQIYVGFYSTNPSTFNITGGEVHCYEFVVGNNWGDEPAGAGHLKLHGGTIYAEYFAFGGDSTIDVTDGVLIADEDLTVPNGYMFNPGVDSHADAGSWTGTLPILIEKGLINAYDVNDGEIITDDVNYPAEAGLRAIVKVDYNVTNPGKTTLSAAAVDPNLAWGPNPASGASAVVPPVTLTWSPGDNAALHDVYFGTSFNDVNDANTASDPNIYRGNQPLADVNYTPPETLTWNTSYFWRVDEVNNPTWKGTVWSFAIPPAKATNPSPDDDADDVSPIVVLSWTPGPEAVTHEVYFGTSWDDVNDANTTVDPNNVYKGPQVYGANTYDAGTLEDLLFDTTYYWRIDEVNLLAAVPRWKGDIWSFTTSDHIVVDDMDSYADHAAIRAVWTQHELAELFVETNQDLVRDGNSMRFYYRNLSTAGCAAEANTVDLEVGTNWTIGGVKALVVNFRGDTDNGQEAHTKYTLANDRMWVSLLDGGSNEGIVRLLDMNDVMEASWHEWNISLQDPNFSGVDMNDIAKVYIGFGGVKGGAPSKYGAGSNDLIGDTVWFDDIEVWPPRCRPEKVATDFTGDCITDFADVGVMSGDWLVYDYNFIAAEPCEANLIGYWKFDEGDGNTVADSSAYGNDGVTVDSTPSWVAGYPGDPCDSAMYFDGLSDYVVCAERDGNNPGIYDANLMPDKFTVSCWTKLYEFLFFSSFVGNGMDTGSNECGFFFYNWGWEGDDGPDFGLAIRIEGETSMTYVETLPIYDTKRWYHLAATYDGQYVSIYVDGAPAAGPEDVGGPIVWISPDSNNYPENFTIGSWEDPGYSLHVDGTIDEVRFYDYALPQGEIALLAGLVTPGVEYYQPVPSAANLTDPEAKFSRKVNFRDFVILADHWLEGPTLWP